MGFQSTLFVITPDELELLLKPFTIFIGNTRIPRNYNCSPNKEFVEKYAKLYQKLCLGEMIDPHKDWKMLSYYNITTDISSLQWQDIDPCKTKDSNTLYKQFDGTSRGYAPYFSPFAFSAYMENNRITVSTQSSWLVTYAAEIMGYQLYFPKFSKSEAEYTGMASEKEWESYDDYKMFKDSINKMTTVLKLSLDGIEKKTQIRVSKEALNMISAFYCIKSRNINIL